MEGVDEVDISSEKPSQNDKVSATPTGSKVVQPSETVPTANNQTNTAINPEDVANSLRNQGVSSKKANGIADAVTARLNGQELTRKQRDILRSALDSPTVQSVISEFIQKKTDGLDSAQNHLYDKESINDGLTNEENAALRDHAYQRVGGDRSGVPGMLRGNESLPPEAFPAAQRRELTAEENAFGVNDYVTVTGNFTDPQVQTTVSGGELWRWRST